MEDFTQRTPLQNFSVLFREEISSCGKTNVSEREDIIKRNSGVLDVPCKTEKQRHAWNPISSFCLWPNSSDWAIYRIL